MVKPLSAKPAIVLLAAGSSTRMGRPKQLLDFEGEPLLRHAAEVALAADCGPVLVVLGAREWEMRPVLAGLAVEITLNERWQDGVGTSIQAGLRGLEGRGIDGAILALADQPFVTPDILSSLVAVHRAAGKPIVASSYSDTVGVPAFFSWEVFPHLMTLRPQEGCKGVILGNSSQAVLVPCPEAVIDIDTPEDYARATGG